MEDIENLDPNLNYIKLRFETEEEFLAFVRKTCAAIREAPKGTFKNTRWIIDNPWHESKSS